MEVEKMGEQKRTQLKEAVGSYEDLLNYLKEKGGSNHNYYKHYTNNYRKMISIVDDRELILTDGEYWNDKIDSKKFRKDTKSVRFGLCFSYKKDESVAMWMLYSRNEGYMISFGKTFQNLRNVKSIECGVIEKEGEKSIFRPAFTLNNEDSDICQPENNEFEIKLVDVLYFGLPDYDNKLQDSCNIPQKTKCRVKRSNEVENCDASILNELEFCTKFMPWSYECECRLIVTVKKDLFEEKKRQYNVDHCNVVRINYRDVNVKIPEVFRSPNSKSQGGFPATANIYDSTMKNQIDWDLCKNCYYKGKRIGMNYDE